MAVFHWGMHPANSQENKNQETYRRIAPERLHRLRRLHRLWASIESLSDIAVQLFSFIAFEVLRASFRYRLGID